MCSVGIMDSTFGKLWSSTGSAFRSGTNNPTENTERTLIQLKGARIRSISAREAFRGPPVATNPIEARTASRQWLVAQRHSPAALYKTHTTVCRLYLANYMTLFSNLI